MATATGVAAANACVSFSRDRSSRSCFTSFMSAVSSLRRSADATVADDGAAIGGGAGGPAAVTVTLLPPCAAQWAGCGDWARGECGHVDACAGECVGAHEYVCACAWVCACEGVRAQECDGVRALEYAGERRAGYG